MSELYHMSDTIEIVEREGTGRMVALVGSHSATSPVEKEVCTLNIFLTSCTEPFL